MLVLTRKKNEEIIIGDNIVIRVLETCGNEVSIGISADKNTDIVRAEIVDDERLSSAYQKAGHKSRGRPY